MRKSSLSIVLDKTEVAIYVMQKAIAHSSSVLMHTRRYRHAEKTREREREKVRQKRKTRLLPLFLLDITSIAVSVALDFDN
jgi:hypothetical protein